MTTKMIDAITVERDYIYKGPARLVVSDPDVLTSCPGALESVMNPAVPKTGDAYALATGWTDLGPTNEDGVVIRREAELSEGIPLDQRKTNLDEGEPENWAMEAEFTLLHTDLDSFNRAWEGGTKRTIAEDGDHVAQHTLALDAPQTFTERFAAFIQEDPKSMKFRMFVFCKAIPMVDGTEITLQSGEATGLPLKLRLKADEDVAEGGYGQFGKIFEED